MKLKIPIIWLIAGLILFSILCFSMIGCVHVGGPRYYTKGYKLNATVYFCDLKTIQSLWNRWGGDPNTRVLAFCLSWPEKENRADEIYVRVPENLRDAEVLRDIGHESIRSLFKGLEYDTNIKKLVLDK